MGASLKWKTTNPEQEYVKELQGSDQGCRSANSAAEKHLDDVIKFEYSTIHVPQKRKIFFTKSDDGRIESTVIIPNAMST